MGSAVPADWRRSKARRTATEPSPIAAATRLTEPLRTSPTANMPGLLVSKNNGVRFSFPSRVAGISLPVRRKTMPVLGQLARQPPRSRFRADADEQPGYRQLRRFRLARAAEPHGLEMVSSGQGRHVGGRPDDDARVALD